MTPAMQLVMVTCPQEYGVALARHLIEAQAAACVNIIDRVQSVYRWQGKIEDAREALLLIKIPSGSFESLRETVLKHHPYDVPEIVAFDADQVHAPYLDWIITACR